MALPITPLIDVIFLLLMYFLLAGRFQPAEGALAARIASETAAPSADAFALPELPAVIRVNRASSTAGEPEARIDAPPPISVAGVDAAALEARVRALLAMGGLTESQRIIVRAGATARWQDAIDVIAALTESGMTRVAIEAERSP